MEAIKLVIGHRSKPLKIQETRWKPSNWSLVTAERMFRTHTAPSFALNPDNGDPTSVRFTDETIASHDIDLAEVVKFQKFYPFESSLREAAAATVSSTKSQYPTKSGNKDRISSLPDELLSHFLPSKYAGGTTILSTRWRYPWTSAPALDFDDTSKLAPSTSPARYLRKSKSFLDFAGRVLTISNLFIDSPLGIH
ncbi:hypothetical protein SADUNF_SadunfUnG0008700 [Salix dunnii]|uniref:Uncharacterized protein n=1 Tax=Salix dunnii TaxID=1413687 RepID=A0A835J231_9ROSI|nr:hypothetical protein SADUNF_SadunfUnG0008700 [Salix dunnii]